MVDLNVEGMTCDGCVRSVTRAVRRVDPDARVSVDLASGRVGIDGKGSREAFAEAVKAAGYPVRS